MGEMHFRNYVTFQ